MCIRDRDSLTTNAAARPTNDSATGRFAEGSVAAPRFGQPSSDGNDQLIPLELEAPDPAQ